MYGDYHVRFRSYSSTARRNIMFQWVHVEIICPTKERRRKRSQRIMVGQSLFHVTRSSRLGHEGDLCSDLETCAGDN